MILVLQRIRKHFVPRIEFLLIFFPSLMKRQLAFLIVRAQIPLEWLQIPLTEEEAEDSFESDLQECLFNTKISEQFRAFGKELGVEEAKNLEDVYKSHLENTSRTLDFIARFILTISNRRDFSEH